MYFQIKNNKGSIYIVPQGYNNTHNIVNNAFPHKKPTLFHLYRPTVLTQGAANVALTELFTVGPIRLLKNHPATYKLQLSVLAISPPESHDGILSEIGFCAVAWNKTIGT